MQNPTSQDSPIITILLVVSLLASLFGFILMTAIYGSSLVEQLLSLKSGLYQLANLVIYKG